MLDKNEINLTELKLLKELIHHPGWPVYIQTLEARNAALLEQLFESAENQVNILNTWRALQTVIRTTMTLQELNVVELDTNE